MMKTYKKPCKELFHVFTDGHDEWVKTEKAARMIAKSWLKEYGTYANIRIYHETEWDFANGIFEDGDCIYSRGSYPN